MGENIFDNLLSQPSLFLNKEVLRHSHHPSELPHRKKEIKAIRFNLVEALKGQIPSNMVLYGVTGAGKTAVQGSSAHNLKARVSKSASRLTQYMSIVVR